VQDKPGQPVENLQQQDFRVFDEDQLQQIAVFSSSKSPASDSSSPPPPAPFVFSNRFDSSGQTPPTVTIILFDALNSAIEDQLHARQQIINLLHQLHTQDHVAIYVLSTRLFVVNDFTQDTASLLEAIEKFQGAPSATLETSSGDPAARATIAPTQRSDQASVSRAADFFDSLSGQFRDFSAAQRAETTAAAIEALANHVTRIPGRKNLVWVSGSFPMTLGYDADSLFMPGREHRSFGQELERTSRALNQANMAVYPVDTRGLLALSSYNLATAPRFTPSFPGPARDPGPDTGNFDTMNLLADRTGGKPFFNTNDLQGAVRRAVSDSRFTYTLGFYPTHGTWDGKFHALKVAVGPKGLTLRYRKGYFATPEPPRTSAENDAALHAAIDSPVEWTNLGLQVALKTFDPVSRSLQLQIGFETRELSLLPVNGLWNDTLLLTFRQLAAGNKFITGETQTLPLNLKPEAYEKLQQIGTKFTGRITLAPGALYLRILAQDSGSGAIGTIIIPIDKLPS